MQFFDIILFALIAIFLVLRLMSVLGKRGGHEGKPEDYSIFQRKRDSATDGDNVIQLPDALPQKPAEPAVPEEEAFEPGPLREGIAAICAADPSFKVRDFTDGAKMAFEMILNAYAQGDTKTLRPLLSADVYAGFEQAIREREEAEQTLQETLVGFSEAQVVEAYMAGKDANVTVKFVSDQISALLDADGTVIDGDPAAVETVTDFWTFSRPAKSRNPNWTLIATGALDS